MKALWPTCRGSNGDHLSAPSQVNFQTDCCSIMKIQTSSSLWEISHRAHIPRAQRQIRIDC
eukprot:8875447-Pyramimonas_sp.AAC.2